MALALFLLEEEAVALSLMNQRVFRDRRNPLDSYNDIEFISRYRITRVIFLQLHDKIADSLHRSTVRSHSIPTTTQLAVTLQFLATGTFQTVIATSHGISQPSVSRCIAAVTDGLSKVAKDYIEFPNQTKQIQQQEAFLQKSGFPLVLGCIDGTHVPIIAPSINEDIYVNRKNTHSINIQAICDSELKFIDVVAKWPGSTHDAFMWRMSGINQKISCGDIPIVNGWFLGDSGYPLRPNLLTPILSPETPSQRRYSRAFLRTRKTIECAFGLWKSRWRSMDKTGGSLCYSPGRVCRLVVATMVLHNICIQHGLQWEIESPVGVEEGEVPLPLDPTTSGHSVRQSVVYNYFT